MEQLDKTFDSCPVCKSTNRFFESLSNDLKTRGLARPEWSLCWDVRQGVVVDPAREKSMPIGSEAASYGVKTDICLDCGCIYAINLSANMVKKSVQPPQLIVPGGIIPKDPSQN